VHIEMIDHIRCPQPHEFTWLVAQTAQIRERDVTSGVLGCPTCSARYPIDRGVLDLRADARPVASEEAPVPSADANTRLAALLGLGEHTGVVVLTGDYGAAAPHLAPLMEGGHLLVVNASYEMVSGGGVSLVRTNGEIPLREGVAMAVALDAAHAAEGAGPAALTLSGGGRLLAPVDTPVPGGVRELARDAAAWVAERLPNPVVVPLRRADG
jgi:uncharacterized protein YbaR (Trm112 family)